MHYADSSDANDIVYISYLLSFVWIGKCRLPHSSHNKSLAFISLIPGSFYQHLSSFSFVGNMIYPSQWQRCDVLCSSACLNQCSSRTVVRWTGCWNVVVLLTMTAAVAACWDLEACPSAAAKRRLFSSSQVHQHWNVILITSNIAL